MPIVDNQGNPLIAGERYKLSTGHNSIEVLISKDEKSFLPAITFFAGYFRIDFAEFPLQALPEHVKFERILDL